MFSTVKLLLSPKNRAVMRTFRAEAKQRGMSFVEFVDSITPEEQAALLARALPAPDMARWGMAPRDQLVAEGGSGSPAVDAAVAAAKKGDWTPAAEMMVESYGDWDLRARVVSSLAEVAADDDGWLTAWRAARPDDRHVAVVDAEALLLLAWQLRGSLLAKETRSDQFAGFRRVLPQAAEAATRAAEALPDDPTPWLTLVTAARGLGYDHARFAPLWQGVVDRAPLHRAAHDSALQYWCAKWRGSHERMFAFAEQAAAKSPSLSVLMLHAAHEFDEQTVWRQPNIQHALDTTLRWLDGDGADSLRARDDLGYAAMALVNSGRAAEAVPLFRKLGTYAGGSPWDYYASPVLTFDDYRVKACKAAR